jgi:hypothetical protein
MAATVGWAAEIRAGLRMGLPAMVRGYVLSVRRLAKAVSVPKAGDVYIALFEAVSPIESPIPTTTTS